MKATIYHNARCTKSRRALELIRSRGCEPTIVEYLKTPPDKTALRKLLGMLALTPRELMRKTESVYRERGLDDETLSETDLIEAMIENPILIERPIVVVNGKAAIGRPPETVLALFDE